MMNETEKLYDLIGKQNVCTITSDSEIAENFGIIVERNRQRGSFDAAIDAFLYGVICGKRIERKRRKGRFA